MGQKQKRIRQKWDLAEEQEEVSKSGIKLKALRFQTRGRHQKSPKIIRKSINIHSMHILLISVP